MASPFSLTVLYLALVAMWQIVLVSALPLTGMGQIGLTLIVWPILAISAALVFVLFQAFPRLKFLILVCSLTVAFFTTIYVFPQETQTSTEQKFRAVIKLLPSFSSQELI